MIILQCKSGHETIKRKIDHHKNCQIYDKISIAFFWCNIVNNKTLEGNIYELHVWQIISCKWNTEIKSEMWNPIWLKFELRIRSLLFSILFRIVKPGTRKQVLILIWLMWNDVWRQIYKIASCKLRAEIKISETQNNLQENIKTSKQQRGLSRSKRKLYYSCN